jgi:nitroreductase
MDAKSPNSHYATEDRIGVLEELLNERYSVRAFLPKEVDRAIIEHVLKTAQRTASWCNSQPWQVVIASGDAKERFRNAIYAEASGGLGDDYDFTPPREYLGVYLERDASAAFSSTTRSALSEATRRPMQNRRLRITISSAHRMSRSSTPTSRSALTVRSIAAPMSAISCWPPRRSGWARFRRQHWHAIPA